MKVDLVFLWTERPEVLQTPRAAGEETSQPSDDATFLGGGFSLANRIAVLVTSGRALALEETCAFFSVLPFVMSPHHTTSRPPASSRHVVQPQESAESRRFRK